MTHAMVITGVHLENGKPVKWRVQNSWGEEAGQKGWFMMTDQWMSEFVYQIVCHINDLPEELRDVINQTPIVLPPWDPYLKKKPFQKKVYKNNYKYRKDQPESISFKSNFLKNTKKKVNEPEKYFKHTYSTLLEDGTIDHKTVFYNKDGYAMSSTANIYITENDDKSIQDTSIDNGTHVETQEEIAAWIAERKKKWPTDENIQKKEKEKIKEINEAEKSFKKKIKLDILEKNDDLELKSNNSLGNIDEIENIKDKELSLKKTSNFCKYFLKGKCDQENCRFKHDDNIFKEQRKKKKNRNIWRVRKSLYTKLVEKEKLQENIIILQVIKHLVESYIHAYIYILTSRGNSNYFNCYFSLFNFFSFFSYSNFYAYYFFLETFFARTIRNLRPHGPFLSCKSKASSIDS
ncbi:hypothetical protein PORY_000382 [Pneumocystis oryctolagi]|uniref:Uncharacterized protein n=1 Tax=Pneumocystis oryctolagi TaxID=42067 RepID=A0ACB7CJH2_9ASCO|nr:hypothetical protein PORY_000382 [Pneumocystis oryctolagi]